MMKIFTIAAMASIVLVGCQKNEPTNVVSAGSDYVSFDAYAGKTTRAVLTTNLTFNDFVVNGYQGPDASLAINWISPKALMTNVDVSKTDGKWIPLVLTRWPAQGTKTQFFAYSPKGAAAYSVAASKPQLVFTATNVVTSQKDLVVAESEIRSAPAANVSQAVTLNFSHALSKVSAKVNAATGMKVYVNGFELCKLGSTATYSFNPAGNNIWGAATAPLNFSITTDATKATNGIVGSGSFTDITAANGAALVIPQTTTAWGSISDGKFDATTKSYIKMSYKLQSTADNSYIVGTADTYVTGYFPVSFDFEANKAYSFNIMFGKLDGNGDGSGSGGSNGNGGSNGGGYDNNGDPIINPNAFISFDVAFIDWVSAGDSNVEL